MIDKGSPKRLLIVSRNLPPVVGGIERLMHRLGTELCDRYECVFVGPRGSRPFLPNSAKVFEIPHSPAVLFLAIATLLSSWLLLRHHIHAAIAGNGLMVAAIRPMSLIRRVPVITMVYGLDVVAANPVYQALFLPMIGSSAAVIACSRNTARLAQERGVAEHKLSVIIPAVDMPASTSGNIEPPAAYSGRPTLISVGRLVRRKGTADFIRHALPLIAERFPKVELVVIGTAPTRALKSEPSELQRIQEAIYAAGMRPHVRLLGYLPDAAVAAWMSVARVHIFPVQDSPQDVEGFGLVALEAASFGVPTVAFDAGGVSDAIEPDVSGILVSPADYENFAHQVCAFLERPRELQLAACREYARSCSWRRYTDQIAAVIEQAATA